MRLATIVAFLGTTALVPLPALSQQNATPQANQPQQQSRQNTAQDQGIPSSQLRNQTLYTESGREFGRITRTVQGQDNQVYLVVSAGTNQSLVPVNRLAYRNDRLIVAGNDDQLRFQPYNQQMASQYRMLEPDYRVAIAGSGTDPALAARAANAGANVVVRQPAPTIQVDPADPRVIVRQAQPQVTVNQPQPEIIVRQPQPTVTVNIPQPEIIVRMPQPDVNVSMPQPDVRVLMARPDVSVTRPGEPRVQVEEVQPQVMVQRQANAEPQVQVQRAEGQPTVRYERAEPRVVVNQADGQPAVRVEQQTQPAARNQQAMNTSTNPVRPIAVSEIKGKDVYNLEGEGLGEIERVILGSNNQSYGVIRFGEFLGLGGEARILPLSQMALQQDRIILPGMSEAELRALPVYREGMAGYREAEPTYRASLASYMAAADQAHDRAGLPINERAALTAEPRPDPAATGAVDPGANIRPMRITDLEDMDVYSVRGQKIGEVKRLVRRLGDNRSFVILEHGGFLGLGEKEVPIPLDRMFVTGGRLVAAGLTETEVKAIDDWDFNTREYREFADSETVDIGLRG